MEVQKVDLEYGDITMRMSFLELYMICSSVEKFADEFTDVEKKDGLKTAVGYLLNHYGSGWKTPEWQQQVIEAESFEKLVEDMAEVGTAINEIVGHGLIE